MNVIFFDTEFTGLDDPYPFLISLGFADEEGNRTFYAELEPSEWEYKATLWVWRNVVPHLQQGNALLPVEQLGKQLRQWLGAFTEPVELVCDSPEHDWRLVAPLLEPAWPENVAREVRRFKSSELAPTLQPAVQEAVRRYHGPDSPAHHALYDALALRTAWVTARELGWQPIG